MQHIKGNGGMEGDGWGVEGKEGGGGSGLFLTILWLVDGGGGGGRCGGNKKRVIGQRGRVYLSV